MEMTVQQLKEKRLIDKDQFIRELECAKRTIDVFCDNRHREDGFRHPFADTIDAIINLVERQEEVQIDE